MRLAATVLRSPRRRAALLGVLVVSALGIGVVLTFEAWRSARDHRRAVTRALSGYAEFAAAAYRQQLLSRLYVALGGVFRPLGSPRVPHAGATLPDPSVVAVAAREAVQCQCGPAMHPLFVFRLDVRDGSLESAGPALSAETRARVSALASNLGGLSEHRDWDYLARYDSLASPPRLVYLTAWRGANGRPRAHNGFAV